jgi:hypothetical protein
VVKFQEIEVVLGARIPFPVVTPVPTVYVTLIDTCVPPVGVIETVAEYVPFDNVCPLGAVIVRVA